MTVRTAAFLIVGNEILSGKVAEANLFALAQALRGRGVQLARVVVVRDDIAEIARETRDLAARFDLVVTSGGVGPTHDDVTVLGVARAFDVPVERQPDLVALIRAHYQDRTTEAHLEMARAPVGTELESHKEVPWPAMRFQNVWLLPGIPEIFRSKLQIVASRVRGSSQLYARAVYLNMDEPDLKDLLDAIVLQFPEVEIGSYPKWRSPEYKTKITFDGRDEDAVQQALAAFIASLPPGEPLRQE